jgi:hypothetical protein
MLSTTKSRQFASPWSLHIYINICIYYSNLDFVLFFFLDRRCWPSALAQVYYSFQHHWHLYSIVFSLAFQSYFPLSSFFVLIQLHPGLHPSSSRQDDLSLCSLDILCVWHFLILNGCFLPFFSTPAFTISSWSSFSSFGYSRSLLFSTLLLTLSQLFLLSSVFHL